MGNSRIVEETAHEKFLTNLIELIEENSKFFTNEQLDKLQSHLLFELWDRENETLNGKE